MARKKLSILGSTGSIGVNALNVIRAFPEEFEIVALSAFSQTNLLLEQALEFKPRAVSIQGTEDAMKLRQALPGSTEVLSGREGLLQLADRDDTDLLLNALVGSAGMEPTIHAIEAGCNIALSNKESLVMAGDLINRMLAEKDVQLFPVDSEHSAIWQCLVGENMSEVERLIITGSGGPFRTRSTESFESVSVEEALKHPNWVMGRKITIDSATMMNKGLEVIEAQWLFDLPAEKYNIVVHPESIIHSMVEFQDGSVKAQLGLPDMKIPIQYALAYPQHLPQRWEKLDLTELSTLHFEKPDLHKFRCIQLAYDTLHQGGSAGAVLNVANEYAVYRFLDGEIKFTEIPILIEEALGAHEFIEHPTLNDILALENWARDFVRKN